MVVIAMHPASAVNHPAGVMGCCGKMCSELSSIRSSQLEPLVRAGRIELHEVTAKTEAWARWRTLRREGVDKGEAEAIAWALGEPEARRPMFVSIDGGARGRAERAKLDAVDLGDLAASVVAVGVLTEAAVAGKLAVWDDSTQELGRPKNWTGVAESLSAAIARRKGRGPRAR